MTKNMLVFDILIDKSFGTPVKSLKVAHSDRAVPPRFRNGNDVFSTPCRPQSALLMASKTKLKGSPTDPCPTMPCHLRSEHPIHQSNAMPWPLSGRPFTALKPLLAVRGVAVLWLIAKTRTMSYENIGCLSHNFGTKSHNFGTASQHYGTESHNFGTRNLRQGFVS